MRRVSPFFLGVLFACARSPTNSERPAPPRASAVPSPTIAVDGAAPAADGPPRYLSDAPIEWSFWTGDGSLAVATQSELWRVAVPGGPAARSAVAVEAIWAQNGADRFVVGTPEGTFALWDVATLAPVARIDHPQRARSDLAGAIAPDGSRIALAGCARPAATARPSAGCGEIYDGGTGRRIAGFTLGHDVEDLAWTRDGKFLVAKGAVGGLTVLGAETGRTIVVRPAWKQMLEVDGWNRSDLADVVGSRLVVGHGSVVEVVDLSTGKTVAKTMQPGKTLAVLGPKTMRVAVLEGQAGRVHVLDVATNAIVRRFDLAPHIGGSANCRHCALEFDEADEDRVWLVSAYTNDRLALRIGAGSIERVEQHHLRSESVPSDTHRVEEDYDGKAREVRCTLDRRDESGSGRPLLVEYCDRSAGPRHRLHERWPYPGFDPSGRRLASIYDHELSVLDVERVAPVCVLGRRDAPRAGRKGPAKR